MILVIAAILSNNKSREIVRDQGNNSKMSTATNDAINVRACREYVWFTVSEHNEHLYNPIAETLLIFNELFLRKTCFYSRL